MASNPLLSPVSPMFAGQADDAITRDCLHSIARLSGDALNLQKLLCFFDPDAVHESVIIGAISPRVPQELKFLFNPRK